MTTDILHDAVRTALSAVKAAMPSQCPSVSVEGVRRTTSGGIRRIRGVVSSVNSGGDFASPIMSDLADASGLRTISVIIPKNADGGWFDSSDPIEGDLLTFDDGKRYAVTNVTEVRGLYYKIGARQC